MTTHTEYVIIGKMGQWGEPDYNLDRIKEDRDWAQKEAPNDRFEIFTREVTEWKKL